MQSCLRHARVNHPTGPIPCFETHWSILKRETLCFFLSFFLSSCSLSTAYWHISTYGFHQGLPFSPAKCMTYAWHALTESTRPNCCQATSPAMESARRPHVGKWQWRYKWHKIKRAQYGRDKTWPNDSRNDYAAYACLWCYSWLCNRLVCADLA